MFLGLGSRSTATRSSGVEVFCTEESTRTFDRSNVPGLRRGERPGARTVVQESPSSIRKFFRRLYAVVVQVWLPVRMVTQSIMYRIRRGCEIGRNFLDDCNLVVFSLYIHSSVYNFFSSLIVATRFYLGHRRDRIVLRHLLMSRLLYICLLLNILFLVPGPCAATPLR